MFFGAGTRAKRDYVGIWIWSEISHHTCVCPASVFSVARQSVFTLSNRRNHDLTGQIRVLCEILLDIQPPEGTIVPAGPRNIGVRALVQPGAKVTLNGKTINRIGVGSKVRVYRVGQVGQAEALLGYHEIGTGFGFCSGQEAVAHFGLGNATECDLEVTLPHGRGKTKRLGVRVDQLLLVHEL